MNIDKILRSGESLTVEFKESFDRESLETVVAFANTRGGIILIGVDNNGIVKGISVGTDTMVNWSNQISQVTEPTVIPELESVPINGKYVVIIKIKEYPLKPVSFRGRCFKRVSNSNRQMSPQEIAQMHLQSTGNSWDALAAAVADSDILDLVKIKNYILSSTSSGRRNFANTAKPIEVLEKLELIKDNKPTWAALLLFGKNPQSPLTQATIHCGRFKGETKIIDDRLISGTIIDQINEVMDFIRKNTNVEFVITGKPQRDEIWDYPLEALREAVINAICHRDYSEPSDIQIKIFDDSIHIWNPGGLPFDLTIDDLLDPAHSSKPRNKLIAQVFYDMALIERYGSGIQRMIADCVKAGLPEPIFEEKFGGFAITFSKDIFTESFLKELGLNERQVNAVLYVKENGAINNSKYQQINDVGKTTATEELRKLVDIGLLTEPTAKGRGAKYELKN
ncbi:MAG: transcriptional regulator [Bacteroidetes bacterium]|nr:transcriptional regulator [Bacteroidota bacterium]